MVLRKPYAFLIKHFRMIHILLGIFMSFLLYKTYAVYKFFNTYLAESKFNVLENISSKYITISMFFSIIIIIGITVVVLWLMNFKKKPVKYYFLSLLVYVLLIFSFIFARYQLKQIEWNEINIQLIKIARDTLLVSVLVQIIPFIVTLVRATGFNIKKFNFEKDLKQFALDDKDNEEFEVGLQLDKDDFKTIVRRRIRVAKYVIRENKYILIGLVALIMISIGIMIYVNDEVYNKVYKENEILNTSSFKVSTLSSYKLTTNTSNNNITNGKYCFIVVKVLLRSNVNKDLIIPVKNFRLRTGKYTYYTSDINYYDSFVEFGEGFKGNTIKAKSSKEYILVFKIDNKEKDNSVQLEYLTGAKREKGELKYNYAKFALNPDKLENNKNMMLVNLNTPIDFNDSLLKKSNINVKAVTFKNSFVEKVKQCVGGQCYDTSTYIVSNVSSRYQKIVMKVDYELQLDKSINIDKIKPKFMALFGNLRYVINNKEYNHGINLVDITPSNIEGRAYLEVKEEVNKASKIYLDFKVRNKIYTYILKDDKK